MRFTPRRPIAFVAIGVALVAVIGATIALWPSGNEDDPIDEVWPPVRTLPGGTTLSMSGWRTPT